MNQQQQQQVQNSIIPGAPKRRRTLQEVEEEKTRYSKMGTTMTKPEREDNDLFTNKKDSNCNNNNYDDDDDRKQSATTTNNNSDIVDLTILSDDDDDDDIQYGDVIDITNEYFSTFPPPPPPPPNFAAAAAASTSTGRYGNGNNTNQTYRPVNGKTFDCGICFDSHIEYYRGYKMSKCGHLYCMECLHGYVASKVSEKSTMAASTIPCPDTDCRVMLTVSDIRACSYEIGDVTLWHQYQEYSTESYLNSAIQSKDIPFRRCPSERCNYIFQFDDPQPTAEEEYEGGIVGGGDGSSSPPPILQGQLFECPECQSRYCLNCPVVGGRGKVGPAHDDITTYNDRSCQNVLETIRQSKEKQRLLELWKQENSQVDAKFQQLLQTERTTGTTKPCPNCKMTITKNGGCDHMNCTNCRTRFNWSQA